MSAEDISAAEASASQIVFNTISARSTFGVADLDALAALATASLLPGALAYVTEGAVFYSWNGTIWVQRGVATFASTSVRDTAYAKASAAYRVAGVEALVTADSITYRYSGSAWQAWNSDWIVQAPPTITTSSGTFTTVSATLSFQWVNGSWAYSLVITITTVGSASGTMFCPIPVTAARDHVGVAYESLVTAHTGASYCSSGNSSLSIRRYDGASFIGTGRSIRAQGVVPV